MPNLLIVYGLSTLRSTEPIDLRSNAIDQTHIPAVVASKMAIAVAKLRDTTRLSCDNTDRFFTAAPSLRHPSYAQHVAGAEHSFSVSDTLR